MREIYEDIKKVFESKTSTKALMLIGFFIIALLIFSAGVSVGFHKASFGRAWGENYERNFGMRPNGPMFNQDHFPNSHGAIGKIIKIELPTIIVQDGKDNTEKVISISNDTKIQKMMTTIKAENLLVDDFVTIIGSPDDKGQIEAKFIRVMPQGMPVPPIELAPIR